MTRLGLTPLGGDQLRVTVANGDRLRCAGIARHVPISIASDEYTITCVDIDLGCFDFILGVDFLRTLGDITWNLETDASLPARRSPHRVERGPGQGGDVYDDTDDGRGSGPWPSHSSHCWIDYFSSTAPSSRNRAVFHPRDRTTIASTCCPARHL
jgi:hypothetical protein